MAKDDYFVLVYKILAYLYTVLKEGRSPDPKMLQHDSRLLGVNEMYWTYIMEKLQEQGYITGLTIITPWGGDKMIAGLECCQITPDGIAYLFENDLLSKAKELLKTSKAMTPFI